MKPVYTGALRPCMKSWLFQIENRLPRKTRANGRCPPQTTIPTSAGQALTAVGRVGGWGNRSWPPRALLHHHPRPTISSSSQGQVLWGPSHQPLQEGPAQPLRPLIQDDWGGAFVACPLNLSDFSLLLRLILSTNTKNNQTVPGRHTWSFCGLRTAGHARPRWNSRGGVSAGR